MYCRKLTMTALFLCLLFIGCIGCADPLSISRHNDGDDLNISWFNDRDYLNIEYCFNGIESVDNTYCVLFTVTNNTGKDFNYANNMYLEKLIEGNWYAVKDKQYDNNMGYVWDDVLRIFKEGEQIELKVSLYGYYETPLPNGEYRLVLPVNEKLFALCFNL